MPQSFGVYGVLMEPLHGLEYCDQKSFIEVSHLATVVYDEVFGILFSVSNRPIFWSVHV